MSENLPRCDKLDGSTLRIVPAYTEAGRYAEANCITVTDGERTAVYVPYRIVGAQPLVRPEPTEWR
jgi:hypothetical protein